MSKKTIALVIGLVLLTVVLVGLAIQTADQAPTPPAEQKESPTPTTAPEAKTSLHLSPNPVKLAGTTATMTAVIDSADNEITAVQMEISYDPKMLSFVSIKPSEELANAIPLLNSVDKKNGRITYAIGLSPEQARKPHTGKTDVATLTFTKVNGANATASATTEVTFLPKTLVSARGISHSVLKEMTGTTVELSE